MMLPHLATRLYGTPLLIARPKLDIILSVLGSRIGLPERELGVATRKSSSNHEGPAGIAVIPIHGTLVHRAMGLEPTSGLTSYTEITQQLAAALNNPKVAGILLDVDSPGGEAAGVFELAARIRAGNAIKPVWAHANDSALSAAYALAAGASRLTVSRTAGVGSIGVIALHVDQSVRDVKDGLTYTAVYAGPRKNDFNPHAPLTPEAAVTLQREVDRLYGIFVHDVAALRSLSEDSVRATEAAIVFGEDAVHAGLADAVSSVDRVVSEFARMLSSRASGIALLAQTQPTRQGDAPHFSPTLEVPMNEPEPATVVDQSRLEAGDELDHTAPADEPDSPIGESASDDSVASTPGVDEEQQEHAGHVAPGTTETSQRTLIQRSDSEASGAPSSELLNSVIAQTRAEALAIAELCELAGQTGRITSFLREGAPPEKVRQILLAQRAEQPDIVSRILPDAGTHLRPEQSPVVAAVRKLHSKET